MQEEKKEEAETVKGKRGRGLNSSPRKSRAAYLAAEHPSLVQIEAGSSESACNDAVNSLLAKLALFEGVKKKREGSLLLISAPT